MKKDIVYPNENEHEPDLEGFIDSTYIRQISKKVRFSQDISTRDTHNRDSKEN